MDLDEEKKIFLSKKKKFLETNDILESCYAKQKELEHLTKKYNKLLQYCARNKKKIEKLNDMNRKLKIQFNYCVVMFTVLKKNSNEDTINLFLENFPLFNDPQLIEKITKTKKSTKPRHDFEGSTNVKSNKFTKQISNKKEYIQNRTFYIVNKVDTSDKSEAKIENVDIKCPITKNIKRVNTEHIEACSEAKTENNATITRATTKNITKVKTYITEPVEICIGAKAENIATVKCPTTENIELLKASNTENIDNCLEAKTENVAAINGQTTKIINRGKADITEHIDICLKAKAENVDVKCQATKSIKRVQADNMEQMSPKRFKNDVPECSLNSSLNAEPTEVNKFSNMHLQNSKCKNQSSEQIESKESIQNVKTETRKLNIVDLEESAVDNINQFKKNGFNIFEPESQENNALEEWKLGKVTKAINKDNNPKTIHLGISVEPLKVNEVPEINCDKIILSKTVTNIKNIPNIISSPATGCQTERVYQKLDMKSAIKSAIESPNKNNDSSTSSIQKKEAEELSLKKPQNINILNVKTVLPNSPDYQNVDFTKISTNVKTRIAHIPIPIACSSTNNIRRVTRNFTKKPDMDSSKGMINSETSMITIEHSSPSTHITKGISPNKTVKPFGNEKSTEKYVLHSEKPLIEKVESDKDKIVLLNATDDKIDSFNVEHNSQNMNIENSCKKSPCKIPQKNVIELKEMKKNITKDGPSTLSTNILQDKLSNIFGEDIDELSQPSNPQLDTEECAPNISDLITSVVDAEKPLIEKVESDKDKIVLLNATDDKKDSFNIEHNSKIMNIENSCKKSPCKSPQKKVIELKKMKKNIPKDGPSTLSTNILQDKLSSIFGEDIDELSQPSNPQLDIEECVRHISDLITSTVDAEWNEELIQNTIDKLIPENSYLIARVAVEKILNDESTELNKDFTPPAPMLTVTQQKVVAILYRLQEETDSNIKKEVLTICKKKILSEGTVETIDRLTRLYVALCKLYYDIEDVRILCCDALFYIDDLFIPFLFTVLTTWAEVFPMAADVSEHHIVSCIAHILSLKTSIQPIYRLRNLMDLLQSYYGYLKNERGTQEMFQNVLQIYLDTKSNLAFTSLILLVKHLSHNINFQLAISKDNIERCQTIFETLQNFKKGSMKILNGVSLP